MFAIKGFQAKSFPLVDHNIILFLDNFLLFMDNDIIPRNRRSDMIVQLTKTEKVWRNGMQMGRSLLPLVIIWASDDLRLIQLLD